MTTVCRTIKLEIKLSGQNLKAANSMLWSSKRIYNLLVEQLHCIRNTGKRRQKLIRILYLTNPDLALKLDAAGFGSYWKDNYLNILRKNWATEFVRAVEKGACCPWPQELESVTIKSGKRKGEVKRVPVVRSRDGRKSSKVGASGLPGQSLGLVCQQFEANIKSFYTHRRNGNLLAELPKRFKSAYPVMFSNQLIKETDPGIYQIGVNPTVIRLKLPQLERFSKISDAKLSRSRSGKFYLSVAGRIEVETNPNLVNTAAIDFGQKRAIVIAAKVDGKTETAAISGKNILALKRERDHRNACLNRLRSRVFKGQHRQYLTQEEKEIYAELERRDDRRQAKGKPRRGYAARYAWRIIRQRRREQGLKKYSRRDWKLKRTLAKAKDYYRVRLDYANHCITRTAIDWAVERGVGEIYVGKLDSLPKRRKKGERRIKQVSRNNRWEMPTQRKYLEEKLQLAGSPSETPVKEESEAYTSQTCPKCGRLHKPSNRVFHCKVPKGGCGWIGDRDGVGAANFLSIALTGSCGNLMPEPLKTLPISPAIGQRLPMHRPGENICELAEDAIPNGQACLQASTIVFANPVDGSPETPATAGKTQARDGTEVLANCESLTPVEFQQTVADSQTAKTGYSENQKGRILQNGNQSFP